eukprot:TRINITY_DN22151_c0_g1_i1.p1 TRINITY_DN22151_c0_g1~~TRINITY_DN22151_c0_g1_i1.p1  ORF type:complete len:1591 (-),score=280.73 TRINITY_DN22151_c0_g1_i1:160-4932(-)
MAQHQYQRLGSRRLDTLLYDDSKKLGPLLERAVSCESGDSRSVSRSIPLEAARQRFRRAGSGDDVELQRVTSCASDAGYVTKDHSFEEVDNDRTGIPSVLRACTKALCVAGFSVFITVFVQHPPAPVHEFVKTTQLNMTRSTVKYPESFSDPREYDKRCDTRNSEFEFGNRHKLEESDFRFVQFTSLAGIYNMAVEVLKVSFAVLMQPVRPIPDADEFLPNERYGRHMALRKCPHNAFVTLGSLVPPKDGAWAGPRAWVPTKEAGQLIELVHRSLVEGKRPLGAEFSPYTAVDSLLWGPHRVKVGYLKFNLPWPMRIAWLFFPIQCLQLTYDLFADSFLRLPHLPHIIMNPSIWKSWVFLSFRHEVLMPVFLRVLRIYISVDNMRAFVRGDRSYYWLIISLAAVLAAVSIPQMLIYFPALAITTALSLAPIWCVCKAVGRVTSRDYWRYPYYYTIPSLQFAAPCITAMCFCVNRLFYFLSDDTYVCTHSRAIIIPIHDGHVTVDAPVINFLQSLVCAAVAILAPMWLCRSFLPVSLNSKLGRFYSVEYIYMQWLKHPLYDAQALRIDQHRYEEHKGHFFKNQPLTSCSYCARLKGTKENDTLAVPEEAVIYRGLGQPWEPACLTWFLSEAQKGAVGASELKLAITKMLQGRVDRSFTGTLEVASDFADGLARADTLRQLLKVQSSDDDFLLDGQFSFECAYALEQFLVRAGETMTVATSRNLTPLDGSVREVSGFPAPLTKPMQVYLKKEGFYTGAVDGHFGKRMVSALQAWLDDERYLCAQWLQDAEGELGTATILSLQYFLKDHHPDAEKIHGVSVNCEFGRETIHALQRFLANTGSRIGAIDDTWNKRTRHFMRSYLKSRGYKPSTGGGDDEMFAPCDGTPVPCETVRCLQTWLRDEGFQVGVGGPAQDGVDGVWGPRTTCALQQFLNSRRSEADATLKAIKVNGHLDSQTVRLLKMFLVYAGENCENVDGSWDSGSKRALQHFLQAQGYYAGMVDGTFESLSVKSLDAWLEAQGFPPSKNSAADSSAVNAEAPPVPVGGGAMAAVASRVTKVEEEDGTMPRSTVGALQRFLNSAKAFSAGSTFDGRRKLGMGSGSSPTPGVGDASNGSWWSGHDELASTTLNPADFEDPPIRTRGSSGSHVGACWAVALFGGADILAQEAEQTVSELVYEPGSSGQYLRWGQQTGAARRKLRETGMLDSSQYDWWGTAELLRCLSSGAWLESAGSAGAEAAILALERLKSAGEAREEMLEVGIATLVGVLRDGNEVVVNVVSTALANIRKLGILKPEVVNAVVMVLMHRLENPIVRTSACEALRAFPSEAAAHVEALTQRLGDQDGGSILRAAEALGALRRSSITDPSIDDRVVRALAARIRDEDWHIRHGACRGLGALGTAAAPHVSVIVNLVDDVDGMVVGAAAHALRMLWDDMAIPDDVVLRAADRIARHLDDEDRFIVVGACEGLGALGKAAIPYVENLLQKLRFKNKSIDVDVIQAAANALLSLQSERVVTLDSLNPIAADLARNAENTSAPWQTRMGACVGLGVLGAVALPYASVLSMRLRDEDEQQIVISAARDALKKLRAISLDSHGA